MQHTAPTRKNGLPPAKPRRGRTGWLWTALAAALVLLGGGLMFRQASEPAAPPPFTAVSASTVSPSTPVDAAPKYATKAIRDFRGFEWVLARNPEVGDEERSQFDAIDHREWRWVELELTKPGGDLLQVGLGRPMAWLAANDIEAGATTWLDLPEMGAVGYATVLSIAPCPDPGPKPHPDCRLVTGVFRHSSSDCVNVHVAGLDAPIGTTRNHRFWSEDRQAFVEAAHLLPGETLLTADGALTFVLSITPRPGPEPVYNLEVDVEHVYYVSEDGVLVHNAYNRHHTIPRQVRKARRSHKSMLPKHLVEHPDIRGRAGNPNRWRIPDHVHADISRPGRPGGSYNARFVEEVNKLRKAKPLDATWTASDIIGIRDRLTVEFGLDLFRPK
ncbi:MAG: polymorphic toxin-type HINT domain-containing protein [Thermoguttaceae bacterium]|jgi:hypothetical protein|nr:polymorphic toxin-type HINT domain-containing protein [Thermoguttaceae bacterium]